MGYRFNLESAHTVANLTFGKTDVCFDEISGSHESYCMFLDFLITFEENMLASDLKSVSDQVTEIRHELQNVIKPFFRARNDADNNELNERKAAAMQLLSELSGFFQRCKLKALLLPPALESKGTEYDFMMDKKTLRDLVRLHPGDSCLILQPEERVDSNQIAIFDAFPHFDIALRQMDTWPAVLLWNDCGRFAFIPIESRWELNEIFTLLRHDPSLISIFDNRAKLKKKESHYYFHLSDLHFGMRDTEVRKKRLQTLLRKQLRTMVFKDTVGFVVTGDAVDTPSINNGNTYTDFSAFLRSHSGEEPIFVLGNHDVNESGLAFSNHNQMIAHYAGTYPKIEIVQNIKVIFLLFNSNTSGILAEGTIGRTQMAAMGNLLDGIKNLNEYTLVAVLHHHVTDIPKPSFYAMSWFERILPKELLERSLQLTDADDFLEWMKARNVRIVLHGHKHIPYYTESQGIHFISCGSSTGQIRHQESGKTYLSYNLLKFTKQVVICLMYAEELLGEGAKNIFAKIIPLR